MEADRRSLIKSSESEKFYSIPRFAPRDLPEVLRSIGWHSPQECLLHCGVTRPRVIYAQLSPLMPGANRPNQYGFFVLSPKLHTAEGSRSSQGWTHRNLLPDKRKIGSYPLNILCVLLVVYFKELKVFCLAAYALHAHSTVLTAKLAARSRASSPQGPCWGSGAPRGCRKGIQFYPGLKSTVTYHSVICLFF